MIRTIALIASIVLTTILAQASIIDNGPPSDANGNWQFDLYNAAGVERGTTGNPLFFSQSGTFTTGRTWTLLNTTDSVNSFEGGAWSVTANAGTNLNTSLLALDTSVNGVLLAQGSTTSAQKGPLVQGAVSTGLPSYTNGQTSPFSLNISGALRVDPSGAQSPVVVTDVAPATETITAFDSSSTSVSGANGQVFYLGTPTAGSAASFTLASINTVNVQATLIGSGGTMVVEISLDGGTFWFRPNVHQISTQSYTNSYTTGFAAVVNVAGMTNIRVRGITSWSGTATVAVKETLNESQLYLADAIPPGSNTIGSIGNSSFGATQATAANLNATVVGPSGAALATAANQTTMQSSLTSIDAGTPAALGQTTMSASMPVVLASDQTPLVVNNKISETANSPTAATVGVASAQALASNTSRKGLIAVNTSNAKIYCAFGVAAVIGSGLALYPGGSFNMDELSLSTAALNCIASAASSNLAIQEFQ